MTAVVGILCKDGVVIGTDSSATMTSGQVHTVEQPMEKLTVLGNRVVLAGTGQVGLGQRFRAIIEARCSAKGFKESAWKVAKEIAADTIKDFGSTQAPKGQYGALFAFILEKQPYLFEFAIADFQPEMKTDKLWYASMGSGQQITDTFLGLMRDVYWQSTPPSLHDGIFAATWTMDYVIAVNPGGINGPACLAVIEKDGRGDFVARKLTDEELGEHRQHIAEAKKALCEARQRLRGEGGQVPDTPKA